VHDGDDAARRRGPVKIPGEAAPARGKSDLAARIALRAEVFIGKLQPRALAPPEDEKPDDEK
jgi:hypothetical protein